MRTPSSAGRVPLVCEGGNAAVFRRKLWELACWERENLSADRKAGVSGGQGAGILPLRSAHQRLPMPGNLSAVFLAAVFHSDVETPGLP